MNARLLGGDHDLGASVWWRRASETRAGRCTWAKWILSAAVLSFCPATLPIALGAAWHLVWDRKGRGDRVIHAVVPVLCYALAALVAALTITLFTCMHFLKWGPGVDLPFDLIDNEGMSDALFAWTAVASAGCLLVALFGAYIELRAFRSPGPLYPALTETALLTRKQMAQIDALFSSAHRISDQMNGAVAANGPANGHIAPLASGREPSRFDSDLSKMLMGSPTDAARGLSQYLCVSDQHLHEGMALGTAAIKREVEEIGDVKLTDALYAYALWTTQPHKFAELLADPRAVAANLLEPHIVAIRLYTCADAFSHFNAPMRNLERLQKRLPHPLPVTLSFLKEGVARLRAVHAATDLTAKFAEAQVLYRGLHSVQPGCAFLSARTGGTELAVTSSTSDFNVAASFLLPTDPLQRHSWTAGKKDALLMKFVVDGFMQYGAQIDWLSVNPAEHEVIYPPMCYLQPTGRYQAEERPGVRLVVMEVHPFI